MLRDTLKAINSATLDARFFLARNFRKAELTWMDYQHNRLCAEDDRRFLIIRHHLGSPTAFDVIIEWVERHVPEIRGRFEFSSLPFTKPGVGAYALCVLWLPDPVQRWSQDAYEQSLELSEQCRREGVPIVNEVEKLVNATKWLGSKLIAESGARTPVTKKIEDPDRFRDDLSGMELPVLIREDYGHCRPIFRIESEEDLQRVPLEELNTPLVVEFIDVQSSDGLYRKYRYFTAGEIGVPHHLQVKDHWLTKGSNQVINRMTCEEEYAFTSRPDRHHEQFQRARAALDIDMVAFDYGYTPSGEMVVWEANPYPLIHFPSTSVREYRTRAVDRTIAALIKYYHLRAGLEYPARLDEFLDYDSTPAQSSRLTRP